MKRNSATVIGWADHPLLTSGLQSPPLFDVLRALATVLTRPYVTYRAYKPKKGVDLSATLYEGTGVYMGPYPPLRDVQPDAGDTSPSAAAVRALLRLLDAHHAFMQQDPATAKPNTDAASLATVSIPTPPGAPGRPANSDFLKEQANKFALGAHYYVARSGSLPLRADFHYALVAYCNRRPGLTAFDPVRVEDHTADVQNWLQQYGGFSDFSVGTDGWIHRLATLYNLYTRQSSGSILQRVLAAIEQFVTDVQQWARDTSTAEYYGDLWYDTDGALRLEKLLRTQESLAWLVDPYPTPEQLAMLSAAAVYDYNRIAKRLVVFMHAHIIQTAVANSSDNYSNFSLPLIDAMLYYNEQYAGGRRLFPVNPYDVVIETTRGPSGRPIEGLRAKFGKEAAKKKRKWSAAATLFFEQRRFERPPTTSSSSSSSSAARQVDLNPDEVPSPPLSPSAAAAAAAAPEQGPSPADEQISRSHKRPASGKAQDPKRITTSSSVQQSSEPARDKLRQTDQSLKPSPASCAWKGARPMEVGAELWAACVFDMVQSNALILFPGSERDALIAGVINQLSNFQPDLLIEGCDDRTWRDAQRYFESQLKDVNRDRLRQLLGDHDELATKIAQPGRPPVTGNYLLDVMSQFERKLTADEVCAFELWRIATDANIPSTVSTSDIDQQMGVMKALLHWYRNDAKYAVTFTAMRQSASTNPQEQPVVHRARFYHELPSIIRAVVVRLELLRAREVCHSTAEIDVLGHLCHLLRSQSAEMDTSSSSSSSAPAPGSRQSTPSVLQRQARPGGTPSLPAAPPPFGGFTPTSASGSTTEQSFALSSTVINTREEAEAMLQFLDELNLSLPTAMQQ